MVARGMTHQEIADAVTRETGYPVSRSTVSAALQRAGESETSKKYPNEIPWTVRRPHHSHYAIRMLRVLGRRNAGIANSAEQDQRLDAWLEQLAENGAVVVYVPDTKDGFFYVQAEPDRPGIPVKSEYAA